MSMTELENQYINLNDCKSFNQKSYKGGVDTCNGIIQAIGNIKFYCFKQEDGTKYGRIGLNENYEVVDFKRLDKEDISFQLFDNLKIDRHLGLCHDDGYNLIPVKNQNG